MNAPVVVFAYNRPGHLRRTLDALTTNSLFSETQVFVCSDGPKAEADHESVEQVRAVVRAIRHPNVTLIESLGNNGLRRAVTQGVSRFVAEFGRIIVVEDDLVTSRYFLSYMNAALDKYVDCERVLQVCGFGVHTRIPEVPETFFSPQSSSWGWGTWKRAWDGFTASDLYVGYMRLRSSSELRRRFDLDGRYPMYFMLQRSLRASGESWAVPWQLYVFLRDGLTLWPGTSLVRNIGSDGSGSHSRWSRKDLSTIATDLAQTPVESFPDRIEIDPAVWDLVSEALVAVNPSWHPWLSRLTRLFA